LGGTGMLGHKVAQMAAGSGEWDVHATVRRTVPTVLHFPDVTYHEGVGVSGESSAVEELLDSLRPDVIINAIGVVKQSGAIGDVKQTLWINGMLPHLLTVANPNPAGRVIQISTDCVFKGDQGNYPRSLAPDARDLYGRSKQVGELLQAPHLTLRTSIVGFE